MNRYIRAPKPRALVAINGQAVVEPKPQADGTVANVTVAVDMCWFIARLLLDPRFAEGGFESMATATEILRAARECRADVIVLEDAPHWKLLADVARKPQGRAVYDSLFADTNYEFAHAIIGATLDDPRAALQVATS